MADARAICDLANKREDMTRGLPTFSRDDRPPLICSGERKSGYNVRDVQRVVWTALYRYAHALFTVTRYSLETAASYSLMPLMHEKKRSKPFVGNAPYGP